MSDEIALLILAELRKQTELLRRHADAEDERHDALRLAIEDNFTAAGHFTAAGLVTLADQDETLRAALVAFIDPAAPHASIRLGRLLGRLSWVERVTDSRDGAAVYRLR